MESYQEKPMRQLHFVANVEYNPLRAVVTCAESGASADFEVVPANDFQTNAAMWELSEGYAWELAEGICEFLELHPDVDLCWGAAEIWSRARHQWYKNDLTPQPKPKLWWEPWEVRKSKDIDHITDLEEAKREMEGI